MDYPAIFSATLGLYHPWHIVSVTFAREERRMDIRLDVFVGNLFTCPYCGNQNAPRYLEEEVWFHDDFFGYATYLNAGVPRVECCNGEVAIERPWCRAGSRFARLLESQGAVVNLPQESGRLPGPPQAGVPKDAPTETGAGKSSDTRRRSTC